MESILFFIYLINGIFLINHEVDSAYWKEWRLFSVLSQRLFGFEDDNQGMRFFLLIHFPIWLFLLYGLVALSHEYFSGYIISLIVSVLGIGGMIIHSYFLKRGHQEFKTRISVFIIISMGLLSATQLLLTIYSMYFNK